MTINKLIAITNTQNQGLPLMMMLMMMMMIVFWKKMRPPQPC